MEDPVVLENQLEELVSLSENTSSLAEILIATTWNCNLNCSYCFVRDHELAKELEQMTPIMARQIVDMLDISLCNFKTICIHFYGGESLLNLPAIESMVNRALQKEKGRFRFAITTNGSILNSSVFEIFEKGNFQIILSIDGPEEIHDECRRTFNNKPTHATVINFLDNIRNQTHCWVRGSSVVRSGWNLKNAVDYLSTLPVDAFKAQAVRTNTDSPYVLSSEEKKMYLKELEEIGKIVISDLESDSIPKDDRFSNRILQLLLGKKRDSFCGAGFSSFGITPNGKVLPCILMNEKETVLGDILDDKSDWVKNGESWRKDHTIREECQHCSALKLCGGGCYAIIPLCGEDECEIVRKNCEVALLIYEHFKTRPEKLLPLAGII
jgi:uncharacterized protein